MMGFCMFAAWLIPIGLIVALVVYLNRRKNKPVRSEGAIDVLEKSYARGEISREEYLSKRTDLSGQADTPP